MLIGLKHFQAIGDLMCAGLLTHTDAGEENSLVTWEAKWEVADSFCHPDHPEQVKLAAEFAEYCDELDTINLARDNHRRQDAHKSNLEKQGTWVNRERRTKKPLAYKPQLRQYIHINPNNTINPDQDIVANRTYTLGPVSNSVSKEGRLVNIYNDEEKDHGHNHTKLSCHIALSLLSHKTSGPRNCARTACHQLCS